MNFRTKALGIGAAGAMAIAVPFVGEWEGLRLEAYHDPVGIPTICYGHTHNVLIGQAATKEECDEKLTRELHDFLAVVDAEVIRPQPHTRRAALASFAYNVGAYAFRRSTLLKKLNAGDVVGACNELRRWVYAGGRKLRGLVRRREAERRLCLQGTGVET